MEASLPGKSDAFRLLGLSREDAALDVVRADLATAVATFIRERQLAEGQAAALLGADERMVRALLEGQPERVPLDVLVRMVARTGAQLRVQVSHQDH